MSPFWLGVLTINALVLTTLSIVWFAARLVGPTANTVPFVVGMLVGGMAVIIFTALIVMKWG